eukprot:1820239-Pleurochrysis_carterae.AAC.1
MRAGDVLSCCAIAGQVPTPDPSLVKRLNAHACMHVETTPKDYTARNATQVGSHPGSMAKRPLGKKAGKKA